VNYSNLTVKQLQQLCKDRELKTNGKKQDLINRLTDYGNQLEQENTNYFNEHFVTQKETTNTVKTEVNIDIQDPRYLDDGYMSSFDIFGIDVSEVKPVIEPIVVETPVTEIKVSQPIVVTPITTQVNHTQVISKVTKNVNLTYDQLESFTNKGFICLNNNSHITGIDARIMLSKLWVNYPIIQQYLTDYEDHTSLLKVQFGLSKEITETKKIVSKGRNLIPTKVEHGDPKVRTIFVQNDRGNDLGLPSEKRSPFKSGLKHGIIDHNLATSIYIDNKLLYSASGSVVKLQSQAYTKNGKSKEHKADSAYTKSKNTKHKRSTGTRLTSSVQKGINTNLLGNLFKIAGHKHKMQVEINHNGTLYLNQYMPNGNKVQTVIGIIGDKDTQGNYQVDHATGYKLHDNSVINRHIQMLIHKAIHHDTSFIKTQPTIIEPTQQLSRRAMKAIKKQQANTVVINSSTNLVSLVKK
jgi:hypothetical protein